MYFLIFSFYIKLGLINPDLTWSLFFLNSWSMLIFLHNSHSNLVFTYSILRLNLVFTYLKSILYWKEVNLAKKNSSSLKILKSTLFFAHNSWSDLVLSMILNLTWFLNISFCFNLTNIIWIFIKDTLAGQSHPKNVSLFILLVLSKWNIPWKPNYPFSPN